MRRLAGWLLLVAAAGYAAADALAPPPGGFRLRAFGEWWFRLHPDSLQLLQPAIERHVAVFLWDPVLLTLLQAPLALLLGALGTVLLLLARRRR